MTNHKQKNAARKLPLRTKIVMAPTKVSDERIRRARAHMNKDPAIAAATISHKTVHVMSDPGVKGEEMLLRTVSAYRIVTEISQNAKTTSIALFIIFAEIRHRHFHTIPGS